MLREAPTAGRRRSRTKNRVHYRPDRTPIPDEPGRVLTNAAVSLAREADGKSQIWDDRVETAVCLLRRIAYKRAHGAGTGQFACAFAELVHALGTGGAFPRSGPPPRFRGTGWDEYFKRNRTSAQRWCERAQSAGLLAVVGEVDNTGQWWRVVVRVLELAPVDAERLQDAGARVKGFEKRRRRADGRGVKRDLRLLAEGAEPLSAAERKRRRMATQKLSARRGFHVKGDLRQPKEAERPTDAPPNAQRSVTPTSAETSNRRGAHAREVPSLRSKNLPARRPPHSSNRDEPWAESSDELTEGDETLAASSAEREQALGALQGPAAGSVRPFGGVRDPEASLAALTAQIAFMAPRAERMTTDVLALVVRSWWRVRRQLPDTTAPVAADAQAASGDLERLRQRAASFEHLSEHRPPGWPTSGTAALLTLAVIRDISPTAFGFTGLFDELLELMRAQQHHPRSSHAGYEGTAAMRQRLTDQLAAARDTIASHPSLHAAENAAIAHERAGVLPPADAAGDHPGAPWPSPIAQRAWRHRFLPPLPRPVAHRPADRLLDPATYRAAIQVIGATPPGAKLTAALLENLVHAFHAQRYGITGAIARPDWRPRSSRQAIASAVQAYEAFPEAIRPVGWPASGPAALLLLATWRDPGSHTLDGKPVHMRRPEHLPMALARLQLLNQEMRRYADRTGDIAFAKDRRRGRGGRQNRVDPSPTTAKLQFRTTPAGRIPMTETPAQTYQRIRRQLLACGDHPADHASLEDAELALIDLEDAGKLPRHAGPSPAAMRSARLRSQPAGPQALAHVEWQHLAEAAAEHLPARDAHDLTSLRAVAIHNGRLILTGPDSTLEWAKRIGLLGLIEHLARRTDLALGASLVDAHYASAFDPSTELLGPADARAARGDRYLAERATRYAC